MSYGEIFAALAKLFTIVGSVMLFLTLCGVVLGKVIDWCD